MILKINCLGEEGGLIERGLKRERGLNREITVRILENGIYNRAKLILNWVYTTVAVKYSTALKFITTRFNVVQGSSI